MRLAFTFCLGLTACPADKAEGWIEPPKDGTEIIDPVSRQKCAKSPLTEAAVYRDRTHFFCGPNRVAFVADPARYAR